MYELNLADLNRAVLTLSPGTRSPPRKCHCLGDPFSFYDATQVTKILSTKIHCKRKLTVMRSAVNKIDTDAVSNN